MSHRLSRIGSIAAAALAVIVLSSCASGSPGASGAAPRPPDAASAAAVAQATADLAAFDAPRPTLRVEPLSSTPPAGRKFVIMTCPAPICTLWTKGAQDAAKVLGWDSTTVTSQFSPESFSSTWDSMIQQRPDVIMFVGVVPIDSVRDKIAEAQRNGAIVVSYALGEKVGTPGSPIVFGASGPPDVVQQGRVLAMQAIADAGAPPTVAMLADPSVPVHVVTANAVKAEIDAVGGSFDIIKVSQAAIGQQIPGQVVTYLQAHPDVRYLLLDFDDMIAGIPEAIRASGITQVKIIGTAASAVSAKLVGSGALDASAVHQTYSAAWSLVDAAARTMVGDPVKDPNPAGLLTILTRQNAGQVGDPDYWPPVQDAYTAAWKGGR